MTDAPAFRAAAPETPPSSATPTRWDFCPAVDGGGYRCELLPGHLGEHRAFLDAHDEQGKIPELRWPASVCKGGVVDLGDGQSCAVIHKPPAAASPPSPAPTPTTDCHCGSTLTAGVCHSLAWAIEVRRHSITNPRHAALNNAEEIIARHKAAQLTALRSSASALAEAERDGARWRALIGCQRVRVLGHAELGEPHQHIGFELWERMPDVTAADNEASRAALTIFADAAVARAALAPGHPREGT